MICSKVLLFDAVVYQMYSVGGLQNAPLGLNLPFRNVRNFIVFIMLQDYICQDI